MTEKIVDLEKIPFFEELQVDLNERNQGRVIIFTGRPGGGKTSIGARFGEVVDPEFNLDRIAVGKTTDFIKLLTKAKNHELHAGNCIMLDEAGVMIGAREWNTQQNRIMSLIFQVIRKLGLLVIITVPALRMIDVHSRILMRNYGFAHYVDYEKERSVFSFYNIVYNDWDDYPYRVKLVDENNVKIALWETALPVRLDMVTYEKEKDELIGNLLDKASVVFDKLESGEGNGGKLGRPPESKDIINRCLESGMTVRDDVKKIAEIAKCSTQYVYKYK